MVLDVTPASDGQTTEDYKNHIAISDFFGSPALALAPSPEHPDFGGGITNWPSAEGLSATEGMETLVQPDSGSTNTIADWNFVQPSHTLSHTSSTSSLNSLCSVQSNPVNNNDLMVDPPSGQSDVFLDHSRHSSFSYDKNDLEFNSMWSMPTMIPVQPLHMPFQHIRATPPLQLQTQGLGRIVGRPRSSSRVQPYQRERSESLSAMSEADEDVSALMSTTSTRSGMFHTLVTPMDRMSLHHRRTSSNTSAFSAKHSPMKPSLTRAHRSASLALNKRISQDSFSGLNGAMTGLIEEREAKARNKLADKAREVGEASGSAQDKLRNLWVRCWLQVSYSQHANSTVPRQGLYHSYTLSCDEYGVRPINSASFGKAVRHAFPGIKTRRLGNRGNSKYHYISLRPAIRLEAMRLNEYGDSSGQHHEAAEEHAATYQASGHAGFDEEEEDEIDDTEMEDEDEGFSYLRKSSSSQDTRSWTRPMAFTRRHTTSSLSPFSPVDMTMVYHLPGYPNLSDVSTLVGPMEVVQMFWTTFNQHQETLADCVRALRFDQFEMVIRTFWAQLTPVNIEICNRPEISRKIDEAMCVVYDYFLTVLLDKLHTPLTGPTLSALRQLSEHLQAVMEESTENFSEAFREGKIELALRIGHLFGRFAGLYQLTKALSPILNDQAQMRVMLRAWDSLDTSVVVDQCVLSSHCQYVFLKKTLDEFYEWLVNVAKSPSRGEKWIRKLGEWVEGRLNEAEVKNVPLDSLIACTGFITSQVVRDFTLRSDPAFGLFQLVKTWIDDWVILFVLRRTALSASYVQAPEIIPEMSVIIPTQPLQSYGNDLSTAVPINHGNNVINGNVSNSQSIGMMLNPTATSLSTTGLLNLGANMDAGFGLPPSEFQLAIPQSSAMV